MTIEGTRNFLLWCTVINYVVLLVWFLVFVFARDWIQGIHGRWFRRHEHFQDRNPSVQSGASCRSIYTRVRAFCRPDDGHPGVQGW